jgi:hypothetical protein
LGFLENLRHKIFILKLPDFKMIWQNQPENHEELARLKSALLSV